MKRLVAILILMLVLAGCGRGEDPYRVDTVIRIPANPTQASTEDGGETELPGETEASEAVVTEPSEKEETSPTEPEETAEPTQPKKTPSRKPSTKKDTSKKETNPKETEPEATKPQETESLATEERETQPAATQPPVTEPPTTVPATEPPITEPPITEPPATEAPATEPAFYDISGYVQDPVGYDVAAKLNAARTGEGLEELTLDSYLSAIASCRAWEISQVWSHTRPDGRDYATVLEDYGYSAYAGGELLVYMTGSGDGADMVRKWTESDSTRARILDGNMTAMGIGVYRANGYTFVCVLLVG